MIDSVKIDRELTRRSFYNFVRIAFPHVAINQKFIDSQAIKIICEYCEEILSGEIKRSVINIPPSMGKSTIISILFPVYCWIHDPSLKMISVSYSPVLSTSFAEKSLELITSKWFKDRWSYIEIIKPKKAAKNDYRTTMGGRRLSTSIHGKLTGLHGNLILIDDPNKAEDSKNDHDDVVGFFKETLPTRLINQSEDKICLIMQRLAEYDVSNYCLNDLKWNSLILPMEYDPERADPRDFRKEKGQILIPERINEDVLRQLKISMGDYAFAQLQQIPVDLLNAIFKPEYFKFYNEITEDIVDLVWSWDLSNYGKVTSDFCAGLLIAKTKNNNFYLIKEVHEKMDFTETVKEIKNQFDLTKQEYAEKKIIPKVLIENKANGPAAVAILQKEIPTLIEVNVGARSKIERAQACTYLFRANNVFVNENNLSKEWKDELINFPKAKYDDRVDALTQGLNYLSNKKETVSLLDFIKNNK